MRFLAGAAAVVVRASLAWACPTCGTGDPTLTTVGEGRALAGEVRASTDVSIGSDARGSGADELARSDLRWAAAASYAPVQAVSFVLDLPVIWRTATYASGERLRLVAPGDAELLARWAIWRDRPFAASRSAFLFAGAAIPTSPRLESANGQSLDWRVQLGSGALEPTAGASYAFRRESWSVGAQLTGTWPTRGWLGVQKGPSVRGSLSAQEELTARLGLRLALDVRYDGPTQVFGAADPDSGGVVGYATPELRFAPSADVTLGASVREPFFEALRGSQTHGTLYRVVATVDF